MKKVLDVVSIYSKTSKCKMKTFRQYIEFIDDQSKHLELKVLDKLN